VEAPDPETAVRNAIGSWPSLSALADFAVRRHGFGNTDGGFGVTYPDDLDDYDRAAGHLVPAGYVAVYGLWGPPDGYEVFVDETFYLATLVAVLKSHGLLAEAQRVQAIGN
jgi:hypothetical protein